MQFDVEFDDRPERKFLHDDAVGPRWKVRNVVQTFPVGLPNERDIGFHVRGFHFHATDDPTARIGHAAGQCCRRSRKERACKLDK